MIKSKQEELTYLSSYFSKKLKRHFGKGPETCFSTVKDNLMLVHVRNFLTPAEEVLLESNEIHLASTFRSVIIKKIIADFIDEVERVYGITFDSYHEDWNYDSNTGAIMLVNEVSSQHPTAIKDEGTMDQLLGEQVRKASSDIHREPDQLFVKKLSRSIYVVECKGTLLPIETRLFQKGYSDILIESFRDIRTAFEKKKPMFEDVFGQSVDELFLFWDYKKNKSYITFFLK
ncbi:Na-translocating system protein MpsC family protein [Desertibacillus haloalkaliphilus]|uniref:Na-translocating system protein MpsC family protein n=1 Tax=Desertibacillus haloalkaliphilus TaxID=1328930 RepID=UPI001C274E78|nr:Na-translocating system protein MpsC family protein [Desertibacillus haloalkaliphilus]MBU8905313.1 DUF2294 domain-containing protein [Desertibacillus haloalkaliphilus]